MSEMNELFYQNAYTKEFESVVIDCVQDKEGYKIVLENTAFYPEGGGQLSDVGWINGIEVSEVKKREDVIYHSVKTPIAVGEKVKGVIDWNVRFDHMQQHSGEHIFSGVVHQQYGYENIGFHMGKDEITLDFSGPLSWQQLMHLENLANKAIADNIEVQVSYPEQAELDALDYRSKKELSGTIRIVNIQDIDCCACCGTHVRRTGEVEYIKVLSMITKKNNARVTIVCGQRAIAYMQQVYNQNRKVQALLSAKPMEVAESVEKIQSDYNVLKEKMNQMVQTFLNQKIEKMSDSDELLVLEEEGIDMNQLRHFVTNVVDRNKAKGCIGVLKNDDGYNFVFYSATIDLKEVANKMRKNLNMRGGGNNQLVQGNLLCTKEQILNFVNEAQNFS